MQVDTLFSDLDINATVAETHKFLKYKLETLVLTAGHSMTELKSPSLSDLPSGGSIGNRQEDKMIASLDAEACVQAVHDALSKIDYFSSDILISLYIDHQSWEQIEQRLHIAPRTFAEVRRKALLKFASSFEICQSIRGCSDVVHVQVMAKN